MIKLSEKQSSDEKLANIMEEILTKTMEKSNKPQTVVTFYIDLKGSDQDKIKKTINTICEDFEDKYELHINVDI